MRPQGSGSQLDGAIQTGEQVRVSVQLLGLNSDLMFALGQRDHRPESGFGFAALGMCGKFLPQFLVGNRGRLGVHVHDCGFGTSLDLARGVLVPSVAVPYEPRMPSAYVSEILTVLKHEPVRVPEVGEVE